MRVVALDHVVLAVSDIERSVSWYTALLDVKVERLEEWRAGDAPFVSLRLDAATLIDLLEVDGRDAPQLSVDHVALVVEGVDLSALAARGDLEVEMGPVRLWGARGWGEGVYLRDPDRNRIEIRTYGE